jgi:hypothetical protein
MIKLNLGASPIWSKKGWHTLDHKLSQSTDNAIAGDASNILLPDESCEIVFCSHVFEHIPHIRLPMVISEINRVLKPGGLLRILTPDLESIARAYVHKDDKFFNDAKDEDESLRTDLGYGGSFVNFIVSPGQDTALLERDLDSFIAGYAHLYSYDYEMMKILFTKLGFSPRKAEFNDSIVAEMQEPLHVIGLDPKWQNLNQKFYNENNLIHKLVDGKYQINFKVTGFDRDPLTSLIVEAKKTSHIPKEEADIIFNKTDKNYNKYCFSLLRSDDFINILEKKDIKFSSKNE